MPSSYKECIRSWVEGDAAATAREAGVGLTSTTVAGGVVESSVHVARARVAVKEMGDSIEPIQVEAAQIGGAEQLHR